jgi:hypothetical protein
MPKPRFPELAERARKMIEDDLYTQAATGRALGVCEGTIERWCKRFHWRTQRTGPRGGAGHPCWQGGRILFGNYWYVYAPEHPHATRQRRVAEHRLIYEAKIGRYLLPTEVVHHIDGNPQNNDPANLQHFRTNGDHLAVDLKGRCPKWTEDGKRRIAAAVLKAASIRRGSTRDGSRYTPPTDHLPL